MEEGGNAAIHKAFIIIFLPIIDTNQGRERVEGRKGARYVRGAAVGQHTYTYVLLQRRHTQETTTESIDIPG